MLLSGALVGGQALSGRAQVLDATLGDGHVVMFAIRPFWRWQTQGTFFLGFNAILNWNDLEPARRRRAPIRSPETDGPRSESGPYLLAPPRFGERALPFALSTSTVAPLFTASSIASITRTSARPISPGVRGSVPSSTQPEK